MLREKHDAVLRLQAREMLDCALGYAGDFLNGRGRLSDDENRDVVVADGDPLSHECLGTGGADVRSAQEHDKLRSSGFSHRKTSVLSRIAP